MAVGAASVLVLGTVWWLSAALLAPDGEEESSSPISADSPASTGEVDQGPAGDPAANEVATAPQVIGPFLEMSLAEGSFSLSGVVPSADIAARLLDEAVANYGSKINSDLSVDDELEPVAWLDNGPDLISALATIDGGTITVAEGQVTVSGQAPSDDAAARFQSDLEQASGLPVLVETMQITDLPPAIVTLQSANGQVAISGKVPNEEIRDELGAAAVEAYGPGNVVVNVTADPGVRSALWMRTSGDLFTALAGFPDYKMRFDGPSLTGFIGGGDQFAPGTAVIDTSYQPVLDFIHGVMSSDPSLVLLVEGHTDTDGDEAYNQQLSQLRADAVAGILTDAGIDPARITATGRGESFPIAPNDTEEGKSRNRRVELTLDVAADN